MLFPFICPYIQQAHSRGLHCHTFCSSECFYNSQKFCQCFSHLSINCLNKVNLRYSFYILRCCATIQVLASLRSVRSNFTILTNISTPTVKSVSVDSCSSCVMTVWVVQS